MHINKSLKDLTSYTDLSHCTLWDVLALVSVFTGQAECDLQTLQSQILCADSLETTTMTVLNRITGVIVVAIRYTLPWTASCFALCHRFCP